MKARDCSAKEKSDLRTRKQLMKSGLGRLAYFLPVGQEKEKERKPEV